MTLSTEKEKLGLASIILLGINAIIGSGIFLLPGTISSHTGNAYLPTYAFVTLLVFSVSWCFAKCAALFKRDGGAYIYAREAFGDFIGFEIGLMRWVIGMIAWAALAVGFVMAAASIFPFLATDPYRSLIILATVGILGLINLAGVRFLKIFNNLLTGAKLIPLFLFIAVGIFFIHPENLTHFKITAGETPHLGNGALIMFYAFGGFEGLVVAAGEMRNPKKNLPIAIFAVMSVCAFFYLMIQLIALGILGNQLAGSETPLSQAAYQIFGDYGLWLMTVGMLISIGGVNLSASFVTPLSAAALAEDAFLPRWMAERNQKNAPTGAIIATVALTALIALSGSFSQLAAISVVSRFAQYVTTCLAVPILYSRQWKEMDLLNKLLIVAIPPIALGGITVLLWNASIDQIYWGLGALLPGTVIYYLQTGVCKRKVSMDT
ncbi:MAG: APC family permease [Parachlamydia sp.]|nr:APC family permease [Parachlamydia sp.]